MLSMLSLIEPHMASVLLSAAYSYASTTSNTDACMHGVGDGELCRRNEDNDTASNAGLLVMTCSETVS